MSAPHVTSTGTWIGGVWTYALWREEWLAAWGWIGAFAQIDLAMLALHLAKRKRRVKCAHCGYQPGIDGAKLRALRHAHGLTLREVGKAVGVSAPYIHDIEIGNRMALRLLPILAKYFDVAPVALERGQAKRAGMTQAEIDRAASALRRRT